MNHSDRFDVCIIGAGAAGCYLARQLALRGKHVALLEAGTRQSRPAADLGLHFDYAAFDYPAATLGRHCGIGGSTSKWGGLLVPHGSSDLRSGGRAAHNTSWQRVVSVVQEQSPAVLEQLGLKRVLPFASGPWPTHVIELLAQGGMHAISGLFLPFRYKNFGWLIEGNIRPGQVTVLPSCQVIDFQIEKHTAAARIIAAIALRATGQREHILADEFIIAAGTLESTRILLELREQHADAISFSSELGKCLGDHLSLGIADISETDRGRTIDYFGPSFDRGCMRNTRFVSASEHLGEPRHFLHFIFENKDPGFALAKEFLLALQGRRLPSFSLADLVGGVTGAGRLAITRYLRQRLYIPRDSRIVLQLDMEQVPHADNCIRLSSELTPHGRRKAILDWRITDDDLQHIKRLAQRYIQQWNSVGRLPRLCQREINWLNTKPHDAFHPVGTLRLGDDPDAVVDFDYRAGNCSNLRVISTGLLPTAGTANPTFTMLCLASDLCNRTYPGVAPRFSNALCSLKGIAAGHVDTRGTK